MNISQREILFDPLDSDRTPNNYCSYWPCKEFINNSDFKFQIFLFKAQGPVTDHADGLMAYILTTFRKCNNAKPYLPKGTAHHL